MKQHLLCLVVLVCCGLLIACGDDDAGVRNCSALIASSSSLSTDAGVAGELSSSSSQSSPLGLVDVWAISLEADTTVTFDMRSDEFDTRLYLWTDSCRQIHEDDDSGSGTNSRLVYTPPLDTTVYLMAGSFGGSAVGSYELIATLGDAPEEPPPVVSPTDLVIDRTRVEVLPPSGVRVGFRVLGGDGAPIPRDAVSLRVINDITGTAFGAGGEGDDVSAPAAPSSYGLFTVLALDMSQSIVDGGRANDVIDGAQAYVDAAVADSGVPHSVAIMVFGRTAATGIVQEFTTSAAELTATLDTLRGTEGLGTTNLYGAYMLAIDSVSREGTDLDLVERAVVILTDGTHEAGDTDRLRNEALVARDQAASDGSLSVFSIGLQGQGEYDPMFLEELATQSEFFAPVDDISSLGGVFAEFAARLSALADSNYVIGVCSPVELGEGVLTIEATTEDRAGSATLTYPTDDLNGNVADCNPDAVAGITVCPDGSISCDTEGSGEGGEGGGQACINDADAEFLGSDLFQVLDATDALRLSIEYLGCWMREDPAGCIWDFDTFGEGVPTDACKSCFADAAVCVSENCYDECAESEGYDGPCEACVNLNCRPAFSACSGL